MSGGAEYLAHLRDDFLFFLRELWTDRGLDRLAPLSEVELDVARWIANGPNRRGVLAFRFIGKTHFGTAAYTCWRLFRDPQTKILIVSKSKIPAARDTVGMIREWIRHVWFLRHLDPSLNPLATDQTFQFDVAPAEADSRSPSVLAQGIDGQITGSRAHLIIADDVETKDNVKTVDARRDLAEAITEFRAIASFGEKEILYIGTPHHEESVYLKLVEKGYAFRSWPKTYPDPDERTICLAPLLADRLARGLAKPGELTCPHRFTADDIAQDKAEGRRFWLMQMQLVANLSDSTQYPLRLSDLMVMDVARDQAPLSLVYGLRDHNGSTALDGRDGREAIPSLGFGYDALHRPALIGASWGPYAGTKMWIDPAGRGTDLCAAACVGYLAGRLFVKRLVGLPGGTDDASLIQLAILARETGSREIYIENNWGGGMFAKLFQPILSRFFLRPGEHPGFPEGWSAQIIDDPKITHVHGQKEVRIIEALEPVSSGHRLIIDRSVALDQDFQRQFTRITRERGSLEHDDLVDALAGAVKAWTYALSADPEKSAERLENQLTDQAILEFHRRFVRPASSDRGQNWLRPRK